MHICDMIGLHLTESPCQQQGAVLQMHIPGPLGMIVSGIILRNVHNGDVIAGLRASWSKEFRGIALAMIFLRSGLELDLGVSLSHLSEASRN